MKPDSVCRACMIYGLEAVPSGVRAIVQDGIPPSHGCFAALRFPFLYRQFRLDSPPPKTKNS